ncbi:protein of unknown function [Methylococcus capsulatus]|uniref:Uncharacterized protein n=1 Tax=Methylococcus capsulatus TaxID=414 RepID=A0AA35XU09_METCP|nr:protein of unknown function [Methylococcus capsulatus]
MGPGTAGIWMNHRAIEAKTIVSPISFRLTRDIPDSPQRHFLLSDHEKLPQRNIQAWTYHCGLHARHDTGARRHHRS